MYLVHFNPSTSLVVTHFSDAIFSPALPDIYLQYYGDIYPVYDGSSTQFPLRIPSVDGRPHCHNPKSNEEGSVVRLQGQVRHGLYSNVVNGRFIADCKALGKPRRCGCTILKPVVVESSPPIYNPRCVRLPNHLPNLDQNLDLSGHPKRKSAVLNLSTTKSAASVFDGGFSDFVLTIPLRFKSFCSVVDPDEVVLCPFPLIPLIPSSKALDLTTQEILMETLLLEASS
ncbi:hypothetical protein B0H19DRAFT_1063127 [Mycena capillaripes]|nr:hypothetical protein B0H19DRAFT_1063127 [Mycena capillaripes]